MVLFLELVGSTFGFAGEHGAIKPHEDESVDGNHNEVYDVGELVSSVHDATVVVPLVALLLQAAVALDIAEVAFSNVLRVVAGVSVFVLAVGLGALESGTLELIAATLGTLHVRENAAGAVLGACERGEE